MRDKEIRYEARREGKGGQVRGSGRQDMRASRSGLRVREVRCEEQGGLV